MTPTQNSSDPPHSRNISSSSDYRSSSLFSGHEALAGDYGDISEVEFDFFAGSVLPPLEDGAVDRAFDLLSSRGLFDAKFSQWTNFPQRSPSAKTEDRSVTIQDEVFKSLADVYQDITTAHQALYTNRTPALNTTLAPTVSTDPSQSNSNRPDGYLVALDNKTPPNRKDIVLVFELKKKDRALEKVIWEMHHIMRNDYRRFTFGITIENFYTCIWFSDRSGNMEPKKLIHVFLSLAFASRPELGFDPTIERISDDRIRISVHDKRDGVLKITKYIAHEKDDVLADYGAESMNGRGTRVWRVYEESCPNVYYALKDCWINPNRTLEADFLREFRAAVVASGNKVSDFEYAKYGFEEEHDDARIGTYEFMSIEVHAGKYLFLPRRSVLRDTAPPSPPPRFTHNVLHELESVWWIALWALLNRLQTPKDLLSTQQLSAFVQLRSDLFGPWSETPRRDLLTTVPTDLEEVLSYLDGSLPVADFCARFRSYCSDISTFYVALEENWQDEPKVLSIAVKLLLELLG